jgi:hypothetical protein
MATPEDSMRVAPLLALATIGCAEPLDPAFTDTLTVTGGCGDVVLFARNEADTVLLRATRARGLVEDVLADRQPHDAYVGFPSTDIAVTVQLGEHLSDATCDDVIEDGGPQVDATWVPTDGHATIRVRPPVREEALPRADLVLSNLVLAPERGRGDAITIEDFQILDVLVGWYAG